MLDPYEIFVHRGAGVSTVGGDSLVPENSMEAFEHAVASGVSAVELDVWMAADGSVVVVHGAGTDSEGYLFDTVVIDSNMNSRVRIEQLRFAEERLKGSLGLRRPWAKFLASSSCGSSAGSTTASSDCYDSDQEDQRPWRFRLSEFDVQQSENEYRCDVERHQETIPTLEEVLNRFAGKLRFNVELKGTDPRLGPSVLEIAKRFPGVIARISTFAWVVPEHLQEQFLLKREVKPGMDNWIRSPNGEITSDLLKPIVEDAAAHDIELALLIAGYVLPPLELLVRCAEVYRASWIHLPYGFSLLEKPPSSAIFSAEEEASLTPMLQRFPLASEKSLMPAREVIYDETLNLRRAVQFFHDHGLRVLVYGGREHELSARLKLVLHCGIDGLCPNDGALALKLAKKKRRVLH